MFWPGLASGAGASHRVKLIQPFALGQNCPGKIAMIYTINEVEVYKEYDLNFYVRPHVSLFFIYFFSNPYLRGSLIITLGVVSLQDVTRLCPS